MVDLLIFSDLLMCDTIQNVYTSSTLIMLCYANILEAAARQSPCSVSFSSFLFLWFQSAASSICLLVFVTTKRKHFYIEIIKRSKTGERRTGTPLVPGSSLSSKTYALCIVSSCVIGFSLKCLLRLPRGLVEHQLHLPQCTTAATNPLTL